MFLIRPLILFLCFAWFQYTPEFNWDITCDTSLNSIIRLRSLWASYRSLGTSETLSKCVRWPLPLLTSSLRTQLPLHSVWISIWFVLFEQVQVSYVLVIVCTNKLSWIVSSTSWLLIEVHFFCSLLAFYRYLRVRIYQLLHLLIMAEVLRLHIWTSTCVVQSTIYEWLLSLASLALRHSW